MIYRLRRTKPYPDKALHCQMAFEDTFQTILGLAERAGWTRTETAAALQEFAFAHLSTEEANLSTELAILQAGMTKH
jgi:hypothetical protein